VHPPPRDFAHLAPAEGLREVALRRVAAGEGVPLEVAAARPAWWRIAASDRECLSLWTLTVAHEAADEMAAARDMRERYQALAPPCMAP